MLVCRQSVLTKLPNFVHRSIDPSGGEIRVQEHAVLRRRHQPGQPLELCQLGRQLPCVHAQGKEVQGPLSRHLLLLQVGRIFYCLYVVTVCVIPSVVIF